LRLARRGRWQLLTSLAVGILLGRAAPGDEPGGAPADRVRAAEIDFASVPALTRAVMRHELGTLLAPASLGLSWRLARPSDETEPDELRVVLMRRRGIGGDARALGSTSQASATAPTIWIYVPTLAHALGLDLPAVATSLEDQRLLGVALGRVLAHEVVHLLAPEVGHADAGVMRERLHAFFLTRGRPALENECLASLARGARAWLSAGGPPRLAAGQGLR
jgi:hypothetical protein